MTDPAIACKQLELFVEAVVLDVGGTLVDENPPATATAEISVTLLPNVAGDLAALHGRVHLAAATNTAVMREQEVRALLASVGIDRYLEVLVTSVDVEKAKPDPAMLLAILAKLGRIPADRTLYIGDRASDAQAAAAAGMHFAPAHPDGIVTALDSWLTLATPLSGAGRPTPVIR